jgi:hypothetical protein
MINNFNFCDCDAFITENIRKKGDNVQGPRGRITRQKYDSSFHSSSTVKSKFGTRKQIRSVVHKFT